MRQAEMVGVRS